MRSIRCWPITPGHGACQPPRALLTSEHHVQTVRWETQPLLWVSVLTDEWVYYLSFLVSVSGEEKRWDTRSGVTLHPERKIEEAEKNAAVWDSGGSGYESPILPRGRKHGGNLKI